MTALAQPVLIAHAAPGSATEALAHELLAQGRAVYTLANAWNAALLAARAQRHGKSEGQRGMGPREAHMSAESDIWTALDMLYEATSTYIGEVQREGAEALASGRYEAAQQAIARGKTLEAALRDLQAVGRRLLGAVDAGEYDLAAQHPRFREDARPSGASHDERAAPGQGTRKRAYREFILRALVELGGAERTDTVLNRVFELASAELDEADHEAMPSSDEPRWRNAARWERSNMVADGLLGQDSPWGIWEITEAGRRWLEEHET